MTIPAVRHSRGRTPLFRALRRAFHIAAEAQQPPHVPAQELAEVQRAARMARRDFLKSLAVFTAAAGAAPGLTGCATAARRPDAQAPRVAIVGAGVAGLNAAYRLKKAGIRADIYEASRRTGGRMFSTRGLLGPNLVTELGGEFIDSNHDDMLELAKEFGLELLDVQGPGETELIREAYFFDGNHYSEAQVLEAFAPVAERIKADYDPIEETVDFQHEGGAGALDRMSLEDYFDRIGATGWLRKLLEVAYVTEYGLEANEQSALNLLFMISPDVSGGKFEVFGESDERLKVKGGNQRIVDELARRVEDQLHLEHRLLAVRRHGNGRGFILHFEDPNGVVRPTTVDFAILTIPFTLLRYVELPSDLPEVKRKAIAELGYGANAKLFTGFDKRFWREAGYSGNVFSDEAFQLAWDNSRLQPGEAGGITMYSGGKAAWDVGVGLPAIQAKRLLPGLQKVYPGIASSFNGKVDRFHWPTFPWSLGSYACYLPGQWTTIVGAEGMPVGQLLFAGEHCSRDFQGFMNGGAETGRLAADHLLRLVGNPGA